MDKKIEKFIDGDKIRNLFEILFKTFDNIELKVIADTINQRLTKEMVSADRQDVMSMAVTRNPIFQKVSEMLGGSK
jgi:hypothetical protein